MVICMGKRKGGMLRGMLKWGGKRLLAGDLGMGDGM